MSAEKDLLPHFQYTLTKRDCGGRWAGRTIRIFKRKDRPFWYVQPGFGGKQDRTRLKTESRETARLMAIEVCDRVWSGQPATEPKHLTPSPSPKGGEGGRVATIADVVAAYREIGPLYQRGARTVGDNVNALLLVLRESLGIKENPDVLKLSCSALTGEVWRVFEGRRLARVKAEDQDGHRSALVSVNAYARATRSIFQPEFVKRYRDRGLVLPELTEFMEQRLEQPTLEERPEPPADLIRKTCAEAVKLKESNRAAYVVFLLGLCSLRRGEIVRCEANWFQERDGEWLCVLPSRTKSKKRRRVAMAPQIVDEVLEYWQASLATRPEWDRNFILPCGRLGAKMRAQNIVKAVNAWMRGLGWTTKHTLHELRAYYLHQLREQFGEEVAQATAGHADLSTLINHYTGPKKVLGKWIDLR